MRFMRKLRFMREFYEVFLSMCFDICAINIRVSIWVRGPHLASSARQASYFVHVAKTLEARVEIRGDFRSHFLWQVQCLVNLADV